MQMKQAVEGITGTRLLRPPRPPLARLVAAKLTLPWAVNKIDVVSLGYPKTGNTWFSILARKLIAEHYELPEDELRNVLPDSVRALLGASKCAAPVVYVTHHMPWYTDVSAKRLRLSFKVFTGKKAIFLSREPKDTLVSLYMHAKHREGWYQGDIEDFVFSEYFGIDKYISYYSQLFHSREVFGDVLLLRYEDLRRDTFSELKAVARFIGIPEAQDDILSAVIEYASIDNMRKLELHGAVKTWAMRTPHNVLDPNAFKVRRGKVGGYADYLTANITDKIDEKVRERLPRFFGYGCE